MCRFFYSLRFRLFALLLLALLPMLGIICYNSWRHSQHEVAEWEELCIQTVDVAAREEEELFDGTRQLLSLLAELPQVRSVDLPGCQALFLELLAHNPRYSNCGLIRTNGEVACTARPLSHSIQVADRSYFRDALQTQDFSIGDYQLDRETGKSTLNFGYPVREDHGAVIAVVFVALDLDWLNRFELSVRPKLPPGSTWTKTDARGVILVRQPEPEKWVGKLLPDKRVLARVLAQQDGVVTTTNTEGRASLYVLAHMHSPLMRQKISMILGTPREALLATTKRVFAYSLTWLGLAGALTLTIAWVGSNWFVVRRVRALVDCTARLAGGDLRARTGLTYKAGEIGQLAYAFDQMVQALERRESESLQAQAALRQSEEKYRRIVDTANEGIWVMDRDYCTTFANQRIADMLGYQVAEIIGRRLESFLFEEDWPDHARRAEKRRRGLPEQYECRLRHKQGPALWALISATPLRNPEGHFDGSFAMVANISQRKRAEEALRELSGQLLRAQDEERRRVARELHDHAAQWLAALSMNLTALEAMASKSNARAQRLLSDSLELLERCSLEVRTLSYLLHPPLLDELGLLGAIEEYTDEFARRSGIRVQVTLPPDWKRLPKATEMALFRVVQECLINVHRHSGSATATVRLAREPAEVRLEVTDMGHGMEAAHEPEDAYGVAPHRFGVGIAGMRERLRQLGGWLEIETSPQGTTIRARVPLKA